MISEQNIHILKHFIQGDEPTKVSQFEKQSKYHFLYQIPLGIVQIWWRMRQIPMHQNRLYDGAWLIRMLPSKGAAKGVIL